ncbi:MAG: protein kinase [Lachnospiraceae bacterium]|nr:protein kinase [Lachnospiraceae bacterium]
MELENLFEQENLIMLPWEGWKVEHLIGAGSYGRVYQISHPKHGLSAVKIVPFKPQEKDKLAKYENAINFLIGIQNSKHIVKVFEYATVWKEEVSMFIVYSRMELLRPLYGVYDHRELEEEQIIKIGIDLSEALMECEKYGVLHRDIKPGNVLVDDHGVCKLADFGNMFIAQDQKSRPDIKGTPAYMAPEVFHGHSYDRRADLYSLGMILYVLLNNGKEPFLNPSQKVYLKRHKEEAFEKRMEGEPIPPPLNGSERLCEIVGKCIAYNPNRRYKDAASLKRSLKALTPHSISKKKIMTAAMAILLVLCVAGGYLYADHVRKIEEEAKQVDAQFEQIKEKGSISFAVVSKSESNYKTETIEALCEKLDLDYNIVTIPQKECSSAIKNGKADCIICGENKDYGISFTNTLYYSDLKLFVRKNQKKSIQRKIKKDGIFKGLSGYSFALVGGSKGGAFFDDIDEWDYTQTTIVRSNKEAQKRVSEGHDDIAIGKKELKVRYDDLATIKDSELVFRVSIGCAQAGELYQRINQALKEMEEEGTLDEIAKKYELKHKSGVFE